MNASRNRPGCSLGSATLSPGRVIHDVLQSRATTTTPRPTITELIESEDASVVLGAAPRRPKPARDVTSEQTARAKASQEVYDRYDETLRLANKMAVPILTQEVFLDFLGYTGRYARRGTQ